MPNTPFTQRTDLTGIAIAYKNEAYIADEIYPYIPVNERSFEWDEFEQSTYFDMVDDTVGPTSQPNQIRWTSSRKPGRVLDRALDSPVPYSDLQTESGKLLNPDQIAATLVMELVALNREKRAADLTFNLNNYPSTQRATLSGTSQWSDIVNSNPISAIEDALDIPLMRPNCIVFGSEAWKGLRRHPKIVEAVVGTGAQYGLATVTQVASLFEVDRILIGRARGNAAVFGQDASIQRLWGKHCSLLYHNPLSRSAIDVPPTWGMTARLGDRIAGQIDDPDMGMRGGHRVRAGESVQEFIAANFCGYFFQNAVA